MKVDRYDIGLVLIGACLFAGSLWQGLAHPGDSVVNVAFNCWLPVVILVLGRRVAGIWARRATLGLGTVYLLYIAAYYLLGFHNGYWQRLLS